jgi:hypothetical protein
MGFWIFLGLVIAASIYQEVEEKKLRAKLLEAALAKGNELDPKVIEQIFAGESAGKDDKPTDPRSVRIAAIVVASIGLGLGLLALALKQIHINGFWIALGIGGLALVVSGGIYIASRMIAARQQANSFLPPQI